MNCPKCGKENLDGSQVCQFCNWVFEQVASTVDSIIILTSRLAIASLVLGVLSFFTCGITIIPAIILGIISIIQIEKSGGRLTGSGFATIGISTSVVAFLLLILIVLPAVRERYFRIVCAGNLSCIGMDMFIYANDYEDKLPRAGGPNSRWTGRIPNWAADNRSDAYGLADGDGEVSITSSFYLLYKSYFSSSLKAFVCKGDSGITMFEPIEYGIYDKELIKLWDFGPEPGKHCSYAYHNPYGQYALTTSCEPGMAVVADRNPWMNTPYIKARDFSLFRWNGDIQQQKAGNSTAHEPEGQSVLFLDGHVSFEKRPYCGIKDDNIYTFWNETDIQQGSPPEIGSQPANRLDSLLVHDGDGKAKSRP